MAIAEATQGKSWVSYMVGEVILYRLFPASIFVFLAMAKVSALAHHLQATGSDDTSLLPLLACVAQGTLIILFLGIVVILFLVRRPAIGKHIARSSVGWWARNEEKAFEAVFRAYAACRGCAARLLPGLHR